MSHMDLWDSVCQTDPAHTRPVRYGKRRFTAIDAQYQRLQATKLWGPYGIEWGLQELEWGEIRDAAGELREITLTAFFHFPNGQFSIASDLKWEPGGECRKKLQTDLLTKALSYLGFSADVFMGMYDDNRYISEMKAKFGGNPSDHPPEVAGGEEESVFDKICTFIDACGENLLDTVKHRIAENFGTGRLTMEQYAELMIRVALRQNKVDEARAILANNMEAITLPVYDKLAERYGLTAQPGGDDEARGAGTMDSPATKTNKAKGRVKKSV